MTRIAVFGDRRVTVRITATKTAVRMTSTANAWIWSVSASVAPGTGPGWFTDIFTTSTELVRRIASEATSPPMVWAMR